MSEAIELLKSARRDVWQLAGLLRSEPRKYQAAMERLHKIDKFLDEQALSVQMPKPGAATK